MVNSANFGYYNGSAWIAVTSASISSGNWNHIVGVNNNGSLTLYVNGIPSTISGGMYVGTVGFYIGKTSTPGQEYYFNGQIDDARIYNRALSASEVQALYNAEK
jgi:hypothetical protein